jgi:RNA polymerase sigma-70 factor (ECF subfamily)
MNRSGVTRAIAATNRSRLGWSYAISSSSRLSTMKTAPLSLAAVDEDVSPQTSSPARFEATRWSVVLASAKTQAPGAKEALAELCRTYWQPLYAFARRRGHDHHRAQDMIQSFFLSLIESKSLARADPLKGKFRSYLLAALQNHMLSELSRSNAQKRGGGVQLISIDENDVESKFAAAHLSNQAPAEDVFEREWAVAAVEAAMSQLEAEFVRRRKQSIFLALKPYLIGEQPAGTYEQTSLALGQSVGAVRTGVHRLRQDFRTHLRREVAKTVESPDQIDEEMRHLRTVLGGSRT